MQIEQQIQRAIEAHAEWKVRLNSAIETGRSSHAVAVVCQDNQCELGRWLYDLDAATKSSSRWACVRNTHAQFHREAAGILSLALAGDKQAAKSRMNYSSPFAGLSNRLTAELAAWKRESVSQFTPPTAASAAPFASP
jgi:hypothetical protein